jgi:crossover junction endodeoxyribonuclease RuvC
VANTLILGIDPGNAATGWALVRAGAPESLLACGAVKASPKDDMPRRLHRIFGAISALVEKHAPSEAAVESVFHAKNARAALALGQARGAALAALGARGVPVFEYSPLLVKKTVSGYGRAEKGQVKRMVLARLSGARDSGEMADAWDAAAVALCHACHRAAARRSV